MIHLKQAVMKVTDNWSKVDFDLSDAVQDLHLDAGE